MSSFETLSSSFFSQFMHEKGTKEQQVCHVISLTLVRSWTASKADLYGVLLANWKPQTSTCGKTDLTPSPSLLTKTCMELSLVCVSTATHNKQQLLGPLNVFQELVSHAFVRVSSLNQAREIGNRNLPNQIKDKNTTVKGELTVSWTQ